jgi:hypothetical protein
VPLANEEAGERIPAIYWNLVSKKKVRINQEGRGLWEGAWPED